MLSFHIISICYYTGIIFMKWTQGKEDSRVALSGFRGVKDINHIFILFIYNMAFCPSSFSLQFYGINSLCPASSSFLYLVSKRSSSGCTRDDNSVSFHHAMFTHQCRNSEKYGINFFPYSISKKHRDKNPTFIHLLFLLQSFRGVFLLLLIIRINNILLYLKFYSSYL